jgi:hypothetical protein
MKVIVIDTPVGEIFQKASIFEYPLEKIWNPEGISLKRRLEKDSELAKKLKKILTPENLEKYIVPTNTQAPTRCIDGRMTEGWEQKYQAVLLTLP